MEELKWINPRQLQEMIDESPTLIDSSEQEIDMLCDETNRYSLKVTDSSWVISQQDQYPPEAGMVAIEYSTEYIDYNSLTSEEVKDAFEEIDTVPHTADDVKLHICELIFQWRN